MDERVSRCRTSASQQRTRPIGPVRVAHQSSITPDASVARNVHVRWVIRHYESDGPSAFQVRDECVQEPGTSIGYSLIKQ